MLLLHNGRAPEESVRSFFSEASELFAKHIMNPFAILGTKNPHKVCLRIIKLKAYCIMSKSNSEICLSIPPYNYSERQNFSFFTIARVLSSSIFKNIIIEQLTPLISPKISYLFYFCLLICLISSIFIPFFFFFYLSSISFTSFLPYFSQMLR